MRKFLPKLLILIPLSVLAVNTMACSPEEEIDAQRQEEQSTESEDVTIADCTADAAGMVAKLDVTNQSSKRSTYSVDVAFESPDGATQFATGWTFFDAVEPGQVATSEAHSFTAAPGEFTCRIVSVDRMEDVG